MLVSRRRFLQSSVCLGATRLLSASAGPSDAELAAMDNVVAEFMRLHNVLGMSVAVARGGEVLHEKGYGLANRTTGEKVTPAHLFRIASVSKPITSVAIFQLIEQGKLSLDDSVFGPGSILGLEYGRPPYREFVADIRLKHLLTHTAGGWTNDGADPMFRNTKMNHRQLIIWTVENAPLANSPGAHYAYSNFGYCILGRVIEKVTGRPYEQHVRDSVLGRCGVEDMRISGNTLNDRARTEVNYYGQDGQNPYDMNVRRMDSHGGWLATASDLVRFASRVDGHARERNILKPESIAGMTTVTEANPQYGCGWQVNRVPNWWHTGSLPGTTSILVRTASGFCWSALLNTREGRINTGDALDRMMWQMVRQVKSWNA